MTRYIAIPKHDKLASGLDLSEVRVGRSNREAQIERLVEARKYTSESDPAQRPASVQAEASKATDLVESIRDLPLTGISFVDAAPEALEEVKNRMPDYSIIEDFEIKMIPPKRKRPAPVIATTLDVWHLERVELLRARASGFGGTGAGVGVAVLDTGVQPVAEIADNLSSSYIFDHATDKMVPHNSGDTEGHGTHVAGLVSGSQVGVAPDATILDVVMIPGGRGTAEDFINAIEFVTGRPEISVMNMSAGIPGFNPDMWHPIAMLRGAGVLPVIAIGNEGRNTNRSPGNYANVVSVGATNRDNEVASFSGGGWITTAGQTYPVPDIVAPGADVTSCVASGRYESWDGTSMATPIVSGLAALIVEAFPNISVPDLSEELIAAVRLLSGHSTDRQGAGLAQLPNSLWALVADGGAARTGRTSHG